NFDGEGNKNLSGVGSAGPLLFEIFNNLPHDARYLWFEKPEASMTMVELCKETGFLAGENCPEKYLAEAPRFMKPLRICPYHESFYLNRQNKNTVCSRCWQEGYHKSCRIVYPADVAQFLFDKGYSVEPVPPHNPVCPAQTEKNDLQVLYPNEDDILWIPRDFDRKFQEIVFRVAERDPNRKVFWYLNDKYVGETKGSHTHTMDIPAGWYELFVVDEAGNKESIHFSVRKR
ncbi:MAG: hypothetical protein HC906_20100, partial [Bacteroidales bacterium]|nr:hypothetical protein [Bacteroidales bacterium]